MGSKVRLLALFALVSVVAGDCAFAGSSVDPKDKRPIARIPPIPPFEANPPLTYCTEYIESGCCENSQAVLLQQQVAQSYPLFGTCPAWSEFAPLEITPIFCLAAASLISLSLPVFGLNHIFFFHHKLLVFHHMSSAAVRVYKCYSNCCFTWANTREWRKYYTVRTFSFLTSSSLPFSWKTYAERVFDSCKDVIFGSTGQTVMSLIFGAQTFDQFYSYLGDPSVQAPYPMEFLYPEESDFHQPSRNCSDSCSCKDCKRPWVVLQWERCVPVFCSYVPRPLGTPFGACMHCARWYSMPGLWPVCRLHWIRYRRRDCRLLLALSHACRPFGLS